MSGHAMTERNYAFGPFVFDARRRVLSRHGENVVVGQRCLALLEALLAAEGRPVSKSELMQAAWRTENIEESNLAVQIATLRKCLGKSGAGEWIATVQRVGYQFVDPGGSAQMRGEPAHDKPSIAVLPFSNLSKDTDQEFFSDGVTSDIITELARWQLLKVQSRAATFRYKDGALDLREIARDLHVRYVVEGSVRRMGARMRIAVQLVDAETGNEVWAEKFDRAVAEIFEVQDQVVRTIVSTLVGRVQVAAVEQAQRKSPASLAAYECVLKGNALPWDEAAGAAEAARMFAKAIEMDPGYGFAYAMLAVMKYRNWAHDLEGSNAALDDSYELSKRAVALDGNDSTCFAILSQVCLLRGCHDIALRHMQRAIELNPNNQWNVADAGIVLTYAGQPEQALDNFTRARAIDPYFNPPWYWSSVGQACIVLRRYNEALAAFEHLPSRNYRTAALTAGCFARLPDQGRAAYHAAECLRQKPGFTISRLMTKEPFKHPADAAHLADSLRLAGLPE
jgi:TolB-like protein